MSRSSNDSKYRFTETQDWFSFNVESWSKLFPLIQSDKPRVLEIGSWEGRSAVFLAESLCKDGGEVICIDHFDLFQTQAGRERSEKMRHNLSLTGTKFRILPQFSVPALIQLLREEMETPTGVTCGFDWVYVDGSHEADDTLLDGELGWRLAKKGAVFIFDDYHWDKEPENSIHHPKRGIDAFLDLHRGEYEKLTEEKDYQVVLRKLTDMRIGFLVPDIAKDEEKLGVALDYGIHLAFAIDTSFAMPTSVAIQSVISTTPGRITIYILDFGLTEEDRHRLTVSSSYRDGDTRVTLVFIPLDNDSLAKTLGPTWAKLDVLQRVPVERVLYLDADILVRSSLEPLWKTDLKGQHLAAVTDVGHPMGHPGFQRAPYFNAGVLIFDLAKAREGLDDLFKLAKNMAGKTEYKDQDVLNIHFSERWTPLNLGWNAQGLGTYARYPSKDREQLNMSELDEPKIVHFTGPVHPKLEEVLNLYVQPVTAKPWGYAGAPGHPFEQVWLSALNETPWGGEKAKEGWADTCALEKEKAVREGVEAFHKKLKRGL